MSSEPGQSDVIVPGEKVYLGQPRRELTPVYRRWMNDLHIASMLGAVWEQGLPMTDQDEEAWFDGMRQNRDVVTFTIYEQSTDVPLGNASLMGVRSLHQSAELGILVGERSAQGKGYGTEAVKLILDYGFTLLGLHRVWLSCLARNGGALRAYERAGFKEFGRGREAWQLGGVRQDVVLMDVLSREFESPVLAEMLGYRDTSS